MNPELQAQTDAVVKAIAHLETTLRADILIAATAVCIILIILAIFRR
jgi:hypothetical protein